MNRLSLRFCRSAAVAAGLSMLAAPILDGRRLPAGTQQSIIAEGAYVYGGHSNATLEHWILSKTSA